MAPSQPAPGGIVSARAFARVGLGGADENEHERDDQEEPEPVIDRDSADSETRPFFVTSEFLAYALFLIGLAIAASTSPSIDAQFFWRYATFVTIAYMLARGLAKSGSRSRAHDPREDLDFDKDRRD
jgi:hypothetical protein